MPITFKCPGCGAAMEFDSQTQMLSCSRCGQKINVQDYERMYVDPQQGAYGGGNVNAQQGAYSGGNVNAQQGAYGGGNINAQQGAYSGENINPQQDAGSMKIYHCQSCGAELIADQFTSATFCSFCGNPTLVQDRLQGEFKPQAIIPFKINRDAAKEEYKKWAKKGLLTPGGFSMNSTIEKISGIYVPFWLYDYNARTNMKAAATRVRTERHGNKEYTYTDHYELYRDVAAQFEKIPVDASEKMPDDTMDKLEPFNYGELVPFSMPYLSGYLSERFNYTKEQMEERAHKRANTYITDIARETANGYSTVSILYNDINMKNTNCEYSLLPVWILNYRYMGKDYLFALNGQTGKVVADRPISKAKLCVSAVLIFCISFIITVIGGLFI